MMSGAEHKASEESNLWEAILRDSARHDVRVDSTVVVVGDRGSGVRSIANAVRAFASTHKGTGGAAPAAVDHTDGEHAALAACTASALRYLLIDKADVYSDTPAHGRYGRLHLWLLTDLAHADLLKHALSPASLPTATVVLVLDMARPYRVAQSLEDWKGAVSRVLDEQLASMPPGKRHELQVTLRERIAAYKPPAKSTRGGQANANTPPRLLRVVASKPTRGDDAAGSDASPGTLEDLPGGVLEVNMGVPLVVVCSKCDLITAARRSATQHSMTDEQLDYLLAHVRAFCLKHGAALLSCSAVSATNIEQLYCYLLQVTDSARFQCLAEPQLAERESLFIPAGADSQALISDLEAGVGESMAGASFATAIPAPADADHAQRSMEDDIVAMTSEEFAAQVQKLSEKAQRTASRARTAKVVARNSTSGSSAKSSSRGALSSSSKAAGLEDSGQLQDFFQSLLNKPHRKPGSSSDRHSSRSSRSGGSSEHRSSRHRSSGRTHRRRDGGGASSSAAAAEDAKAEKK